MSYKLTGIALVRHQVQTICETLVLEMYEAYRRPSPYTIDTLCKAAFAIRWARQEEDRIIGNTPNIVKEAMESLLKENREIKELENALSIYDEYDRDDDTDLNFHCWVHNKMHRIRSAENKPNDS